MTKAKPYILPVAIVLGLLFHSYSPYVTPLVPYVIFSILLLNFSAIKLSTLCFNKIDFAIMLFQTFVSLGAYWLVKLIGWGEIAAQGALMCILCPVASAVVVVASALGADRRTTTGYTIFGNVLVTIIAPLYFSFIGTHQDAGFWQSAAVIFQKVATVIALPWLIAWVLQHFAPKVSSTLGKLKEWALPLWAFALFATLGQTIDYIFIYHQSNEFTIIKLAVIALIACILQFGIGRLAGRRFGEPIAAGQLCGQKNSAMGIWMALKWLEPLSSVVLAFYSIYQNLFNSWQMWHYRKRSGV